MKKRIPVIITIILTVVMALSVFSACSFLKTDEKKDALQVIAAVKTEDAETKEILKRDLISIYNSYGYIYVNYYGFSVEDTLKLLADSLIDNAVMIQESYRYFDGVFANKSGDAYLLLISRLEDGERYDDSKTGKYNIDRYLTNYDITTAKYELAKTLNDSIKSFIEEKEESGKDTSVETTRTTPTGATMDKDVTIDEKAEYIAKTGADAEEEGSNYVNGLNVGVKGSKRYEAYVKLIKTLQNNYQLDEDFDINNDSLFDSEYYADRLLDQKENLLRQKYEFVYNYVALKQTTFADLSQRYLAIYNEKTADTANRLSNFVSDLNNYSATSPLTYIPYDGYGFVYNLLIGLDDVQSGKLTQVKGKLSGAEYSAARKEIFEGVTATDLRSTWITEGYGEIVDGEFVFNDTYSTLNFNGNVKEVGEEEYKVDHVNTLTMEELAAFIDEYLFTGAKSDLEVSSEYGYADDYYAAATFTGYADDFKAKVDNLLFAYSTDPGSLNTYAGYLITPAAEIGGQETFVEEFALASRFVLDNMDDDRPGYAIVATDYGYHVIIYSKTVKAADTCDSLVKCLNYNTGKNLSEAEWISYYAKMLEDIENNEYTDTYIYSLLSSYTTLSSFSKNQEAVIYKYEETEGAITKYESRYGI